MRLVVIAVTSVALVGCAVPNVASTGPCDRAIDQLDQAVGDRASGVMVYLQDSVTAQQVNALTLRGQRMPEVEDVAFVSKGEALNRAREMFRDTPEVLEGLPGNPFPASLELTVEPDKAEAVARTFDGLDGVDGVKLEGEASRELIRDYRDGGDQAEICRTITEPPGERMPHDIPNETAVQVDPD